jgi:hypothetical protein
MKLGGSSGRFMTRTTGVSSLRYHRRPYEVSMRLFADSKTEEKKEEMSNSIKATFQKYGYVAVGTYLSLYVVTLSSLFVALDLDLLHSSTFGFDPIATTTKVSSMVIGFYC